MIKDYVIIIANDVHWAARARARLEAESDVRMVSSTRQSAVLVGSGRRRIALDHHRGAIIGKLFTRESRSAGVVALSENIQAQILASNGRRLLSGFWGGYVAVLDDVRSGSLRVMRDPSAEMPCWFIEKPEGVVLSNDVETLLAIGDIEPQVNWPYITQLLLGRNLPSVETGLLRVSELPAGHEYVVQGGRSAVLPCWSPWEHADAGQVEAVQISQAAEKIRETVIGCVGAHARSADHVLLSVSGGLDSSIVAAGLAASGRSFSCFTQSTRDAAGDERPYARTLAHHFGVNLREPLFEPERIDILKTHADHLARPAGHKLGQETLRAAREAGAADGAAAYFSGVGGDNVFCLARTASAIVDRVLVEGWSKPALRTLLDVCELTDCSVWDAGGRALEKYFARDRSFPQRPITTFMLRDAIQTHGKWERHPWLDRPRALPGKMFHVALCLTPQNVLGAWPGDLDYCAPLLSQPIIEECLRIPSWLWCDRGADRAVARLAFADLLPPEIIGRRIKGTPAGASAALFERNRALLGDTLATGNLVANRVIDADALENELAQPRVPLEAYNRILQFADVEAWARAWIGRRPVLRRLRMEAGSPPPPTRSALAGGGPGCDRQRA